MKRFLSMFMSLILAAGVLAAPAAADVGASGNGATPQGRAVPGKKYTFDEDAAYAFSARKDYESTDAALTCGSFQILGTEAALKKAGVRGGTPAFSVEAGNIEISYTCSDELLRAPEDEIHLESDKGKTVDGMELGGSVGKGALILQRSIDGVNWCDLTVRTNVFEDTPQLSEPLYTTTDVELINGAYYRLIVAYQTAVRGEPKKIAGLISKKTYTYQWHAEVYEFFAELKDERIEPLTQSMKRFSLGETVKVSDGEGYAGEEQMGTGDLHYGWDLGQFFVSGYTDQVKASDGSVVFLKNVGDVVTLWFHLKQNVSALNGDKALYIDDDEAGSDQYFRTPQTRFGRGMLIVRYTDHENVKHDPVMYSDYLAANATLGANTRAQLFEEGDYEVALDYKVKKDGLLFLDSAERYRIFFKFSVRNANCMVYPFDVKTGSELTNSAMTENGFYLDLARSRYLKIFIRKDVRTQGADGLTEDTRFNTSAKDGAKYTEEGIYTITAKNQYTGLETTKRIYVGTDPVMKAHMTTGYSIGEIVKLTEEGAKIDENGVISMPSAPEVEELPVEPEEPIQVSDDGDPGTDAVSKAPEQQQAAEEGPAEEEVVHEEEKSGSGGAGVAVGIAAVAAAAGGGGYVFLKKRRAGEVEK